MRSSSFREKISRILLGVVYDLTFLLVLLIGSPFFIYRIFTTPRFRAGFFERLGFIPKRDRSKPCLWVHGVSVGETKAARPFVEQFAARHPEIEIVISNTTQGGHALSERFFPHLTRFYYPLDFSFITSRALRRMSPIGIVLMELEVWPNFLIQARKRGIPVFVINGRLSERSFKGYRRIRRLLPQFDWVDLYSVQNEQYEKRFLGLGIQPEKIQVTGNTKFDETALAPKSLPTDPGIQDLLSLRKGEKILVCGSTHYPEEATLCRIAQALEAKGLGPLCLLIAPRQPDRTQEVVDSVASVGMKAMKLTELRQNRQPLPLKAVLVIDTIGELEKFYSVADLVFVGGSLIPRGGHNVLEPAAIGKPVFVGPHTFNFVSEVSLLVSGNAIVQVKNEPELRLKMQKFLENPSERNAMGQRAVQLIREHQGATLRTVKAVEERLFKG